MIKRACILLIVIPLLVQFRGVAQVRPGVIYDTVACLADSNYTYSLYIPVEYDSTYPDYGWPVIFAFDPFARGVLPVELLRFAADDYGYIIAGSNNVGNGPWDGNLVSAGKMFDDVGSRLNIDSERVYLAGFSGGARIASSIAMLSGDIAGVIACGAGFDISHPPNININFEWVGLVGNVDFNFQEMMRLDRWLKNFNISHELIEFPGEHYWPPIPALNDAVLWLTLRAMDKHYKYNNYYVLRDFHREMEARALQYREDGEEYRAFRTYQYMVTALKGVKETGQYEAALLQLMSDTGFRHEVRVRQRISEIETDRLQAYRDALRAYRSHEYEPNVRIEPMSWWKSEIRYLRRFIDEPDYPPDTLLGLRLIDYIWRTAFSQYEAVLNTPEEDLAPIYLQVWSLAQPSRPIPEYLLARYYSREGETSRAIGHLETSIKRGFNHLDVIREDTLITSLREHKKWLEVISTIDTVGMR